MPVCPSLVGHMASLLDVLCLAFYLQNMACAQCVETYSCAQAFYLEGTAVPDFPFRGALVEGHARRLQEFHVASGASLSGACLDQCPDLGHCLSKGGHQGNHMALG